MKKPLTLIISLLAISTACFAGCAKEQPDNDEQEPETKIYEIINDDNNVKEDENCPDGKCPECPDGKRPDSKRPGADGENDEKNADPDFIFEAHRFHGHGGGPRHGSPGERAPYRHYGPDMQEGAAADEDVETRPQPAEPKLPRSRKKNGHKNPLPKPRPSETQSI